MKPAVLASVDSSGKESLASSCPAGNPSSSPADEKLRTALVHGELRRHRCALSGRWVG